MNGYERSQAEAGALCFALFGGFFMLLVCGGTAWFLMAGGPEAMGRGDLVLSIMALVGAGVGGFLFVVGAVSALSLLR